MQKAFVLRSAWLCAIAFAVAAMFTAGSAVSPGTSSPAFANTDPSPAPATKKKKKRKKKKRKKRRKSETLEAPAPQLTYVADLAEYKQANAQIKAGDYRAAIATLNSLNRPEDANVLNLLGYSHRKLGLIDVGMRYYLAALERNPEHRAVHEYLGEAYLQKDDLGKARVMLKKLGQLCGIDCKHYKDLAAAIAEYEKKHSL